MNIYIYIYLDILYHIFQHLPTGLLERVGKGPNRFQLVTCWRCWLAYSWQMLHTNGSVCDADCGREHWKGPTFVITDGQSNCSDLDHLDRISRYYLPKMNGWLGRDILGFETYRGNS